MDKISIALAALLSLAMVILIAPSVIAMNRGKALRNIAIWLAIFTAVGLIYKTVGPGSSYPLFDLPDGIAMRYGPQPAADKNDEVHDGFTPPKD